MQRHCPSTWEEGSSSDASMNVCTENKENTHCLSPSSFSIFAHIQLHSELSYWFSFVLCFLHSLAQPPCNPPTNTIPLSITISVAMGTAILNGPVGFFSNRKTKQPKQVSRELFMFVVDQAAANLKHKLIAFHSIHVKNHGGYK